MICRLWRRWFRRYTSATWVVRDAHDDEHGAMYVAVRR